MAASRVLILGGGSREHALAARIASEGHAVLAMPGNAGTARIGGNLPGRPDAVAAVVAAAKEHGVDLVVVGPEAPLVAGVVDALEAAGIRAFGPRRAAAALEGSKAFMKRFLKRHAIPTAAFEVFDDADEAERYVRAAGRPLVVKTDGLAAGKGVVVASSTDEALAAVGSAMRDRAFGDAGKSVVIEEVLQGEEASFHVLCDGERFVSLPAAQDHKRVLDGDRGPNTGGMGAYAPAPIVTPEIASQVEREVVVPTLRGMREEGTPFRGVLFVGLMIHQGKASVLEFNVRFGDPEACVLVPLLGGSLYELLYSASIGSMPERVAVRSEASLCVVMASEGYPQAPRTGDPIEGLDAALAEGVYVLHAGTRADDGVVRTSGGRVLAVGATATTLEAAAERAYDAVSRIRFRGEHHRSDIGWRVLGGRPSPSS
ncbi:MAG TPA: phosphoribosylamine--glycine ligase [Polyangiaceae bacterium]|nr:phosphoribosylamine--glycine ligase [Polyangiaceae bacterium]